MAHFHLHPHHHLLPNTQSLIITTFNMLAPCYKRLHDDQGRERPDRERDHHSMWTARQDDAFALLDSLSPHPDILLLQEVWFDDEYLARLESALSHEYQFYYAQHPSPKRDGVATLIRRQCPHFNHHLPFITSILSVPLNPLRVSLALTIPLCNSTDNLLIVNTHLSFPHCPKYAKMRDEEVQNAVLHALHAMHHDDRLTAIVAGDFNADTKSSVADVFREAGFVNCYSQVNGPQAYPITHFNHCNQSEFVDHIYLKTPSFLSSQSTSTCSIPSITTTTATATATATESQSQSSSSHLPDLSISLAALPDSFSEHPHDTLSSPPISSITSSETNTAATPTPNPTPLTISPNPSLRTSSKPDVLLPSLKLASEKNYKPRRSTSAHRVEDAPFECDSEPITPPLPQQPPPSTCNDFITTDTTTTTDTNMNMNISIDDNNSPPLPMPPAQPPPPPLTLKPVATANFPYDLSTTTWPTTFSVSDHRPSTIHFTFCYP